MLNRRQSWQTSNVRGKARNYMLSLLRRENFIQVFYGDSSSQEIQVKLKQAKFPLADCFLLIGGKR